MSHRVLMIEDDRALAQMVGEYLGAAGFDVELAGTAHDGTQRLRRDTFDAVLLDVMLPDGDGFDVCRSIRVESDVPILMLTARGEEADRIVGLEIGADDYLPKPFSPRELLARLRAILRRRAPTEAGSGILRVGQLEIDLGARRVRVDGDERDLTGYQFDLLAVLAENAGRVLSRDYLMTRLQGTTLEAFDRSIDVHISRLRAAIEEEPRKPRRLLTVRGAGYVLAREPE